MALLDDSGQTVSLPFTSGRDAYWNMTEDVGSQFGSEVSESGRTVTLDLSAVPDGTDATLVFRLVNNDADTGTSVRITQVELLGEGNDQPPTASIRLANDTAPAGPDTDIYRTDGLTNDATVTGQVNDAEGIHSVQIVVDGGPAHDITANVVNGQFSFNPGQLSPGLHNVSVRVEDTAGQVATDSVEFESTRSPLPLREAIKQSKKVPTTRLTQPHRPMQRHLFQLFVAVCGWNHRPWSASNEALCPRRRLRCNPNRHRYRREHLNRHRSDYRC